MREILRQKINYVQFINIAEEMKKNSNGGFQPFNFFFLKQIIKGESSYLNEDVIEVFGIKWNSLV